MSIRNKIYCLGDGYAHGHIWPEWPQILSALLSELDTVIISGVGAGNEFLINRLLQHDITNQIVIFQWAIPDRFDKIIEDKTWDGVGKSDPIYHFNFYHQDNITWWLSSASTNSLIKFYHNFYVQKKQAQIRMHDQQKLVEGYLASKHCEYLKISTEQQFRYSNQKRFLSTRGTEIQPSPIVHFNFLKEIILPKLSISYSKNKIDYMETLIQETNWMPYDPDRAEIWQNIVNKLINIS